MLLNDNATISITEVDLKKALEMQLIFILAFVVAVSAQASFVVAVSAQDSFG